MYALWSRVVFAVLAASASVAASPVENMVPAYKVREAVTPAPTSTSAGDSATLTVTTPTTPTANCTTTIFEGGKFGPLSRPTCTFYESYTTLTEYVDCGGCELERLAFGPGPAVRCGTNVNAPLGTQTVTTCSPDNVTAPATPTPTLDHDPRYR